MWLEPDLSRFALQVYVSRTEYTVLGSYVCRNHRSVQHSLVKMGVWYLLVTSWILKKLLYPRCRGERLHFLHAGMFYGVPIPWHSGKSSTSYHIDSLHHRLRLKAEKFEWKIKIRMHVVMLTAVTTIVLLNLLTKIYNPKCGLCWPFSTL